MITPKVLIPIKYAENSQTTQYTANGVKARIDSFTATNNDSVTRTISVNKVTSGGTAGGDNIVTKTKSLQPGETYSFPELRNKWLEASGFISTIASASSAINIECCGIEWTA